MLSLKIKFNFLYGVKCEACTDLCSFMHVFTIKDLNLRQQRSMELLKDYNVTIQFHPSKASVVEDALSIKVVSIGS